MKDQDVEIVSILNAGCDRLTASLLTVPSRGAADPSTDVTVGEV